VAKHGNRAVSSKSGSADFYQSLGISISLKPVQAQELLQQTSFAFLFAPHYHSAMRFAGPVRKELGMKTIMNVLGPLANPGESEYQMLGVYDKALMERIAAAGTALGMKRVMTVHGEDGEDEMSVTGPTSCCLITTDAGKAAGGKEAADGKEPADGGETMDGGEKAGKAEISKEFFTAAPEDFGLRRFPAEAIRGGSPEENAAVARLIFGYSIEETLTAAGADPDDAVLQAVKTSVVLNGGAALFVAEAAESIAEGVKLAQNALESGEVRRKMEQISAVSQKLAAAAVTAEG
jgi:anthranilate synthase/phosphoribosyltransferase